MHPSAQILLVDDDRIILDIVSGFLQRFACEISCAESVEGALQLLERQRFDLVLTDLQLGNGSGLDVLRRAQQKNSRCRPVLVMMTGSRDMELIAAGYEAGADKVVLKPLSMAILRQSFLEAGVKLTLDINRQRTVRGIGPRRQDSLQSVKMPVNTGKRCAVSQPGRSR